jgi:hypothetical protein
MLISGASSLVLTLIFPSSGVFMISSSRFASSFGRLSCLFAIACVLGPVTARGDIFRYDNHRLIAGTSGITPGPGVNFSSLNLSYADLIGLDLTDSRFTSANVRYARFTDSDLRGATGWALQSGTVAKNTIRPTGIIQGLSLGSGEMLVIRNDEIAINVRSSASTAATSTLRFVLEDDWTSTVTMAASISPSLKGTLNLTLDPSANAEALVGHTFDLFNWGRTVATTKRFSAVTSAPGFTWDTSKLYTTGEVTLTGAPATPAGQPIPEPASLAVLGLGVVALLARRKRA